MARKPLPRPTDAELAILRVLWEHGPCTVRQVLEHLPDRRGYTTILKLLQIMAEKDLVERDAAGQTHTYWARHSEEDTQRHLVRDLLGRAFGKSPQKLVMQALTEHPASPEERAEIRKLLDELERKD